MLSAKSIRNFLTLFIALVVTTAFVLPEAEAKRFGGGKSFGKSYNYSRSAKQPSAPGQNNLGNQQNTRQAAPGGAANPASRGGMMGGMFGGLLAGGLLGALFFGGAFEGFQLMDFLIIGLLAFLGFKLLRGLSARSQPQPTAYAGGAGQTPAEPAYQPPAEPTAATPQQRNSAFSIPEIGAKLKGEPLSVTPPWFNEAMFMAEAESHFREVQAAWDKGDFDAIQGYVTPEFFAQVKSDYDGLDNSPNTQIESLNSQLLDLLKDGEEVVAAILFTGVLSEDGAAPAEFAEVWHVRHPLHDEGGDWKIEGIHQYEMNT